MLTTFVSERELVTGEHVLKLAGKVADLAVEFGRFAAIVSQMGVNGGFVLVGAKARGTNVVTVFRLDDSHR